MDNLGVCIYHASKHFCLELSTLKTEKDGTKTCRDCAEVHTMGICPKNEKIRQKCIDQIESLSSIVVGS